MWREGFYCCESCLAALEWGWSGNYWRFGLCCAQTFSQSGEEEAGEPDLFLQSAAKYVPLPSVSGDAASQASPDKVRPTSITTWSNKPEIPPPVWSASLIFLEQELVGDITRRVLSIKLDLFLPFTMFSQQKWPTAGHWKIFGQICNRNGAIVIFCSVSVILCKVYGILCYKL